MKKTEGFVEMKPIIPQQTTIHIVGDGDLILNQMNAPTRKALADQRKDKAKSLEKPNYWECVITSIHWYDGTPTDFTEEGMKDALANNAPCITSFGLMKSWGQAVVRNEIDKYATKFDANVNVVARGGLVPIKFAEHYIDEKLMSPKRGAPVLCNINRFTGWSADITINYLENTYSLEQILNIINMAGFGLGIGSGRTSGYGRYHIESIK